MPRRLEGDELEPFEKFLNRYYKEDILELASVYADEESLVIDYRDIEMYNVDLADDLTDNPDIILPAFEDALANIPIPVDVDLSGAHVRVINARPNKSIGELRSKDIGKYISITGLVEEVTQVKPEIIQATWECVRCLSTTETQTVGDTVNEPHTCPSCDREGPFRMMDSQTEVRDKQLIKLQPLPEESGGNTDNSIPIMSYNDLAGEVSPGDRLKVNGQLQMDTDNILTETHPDAMRDLYLGANGFEREQESFDELETERKEEIKELSKKENLFELFRKSFAPHILTDGYGDTIKLAIILQLFGGIRRELPGGATRKGDINVLMVGEPGTGKSQFINTAKAIAPKGVKASGKGATAAGLTATAEKSELTGSWTLKAGALVQANNGFAAVDEFDKMSDGARKSMHEALEDQEIPINKAGINVTLPARCSVLAGANPKYGTFDRYEALSEQIELGPALISRFDMVFGLTQNVDEERDKDIAKHQLKHSGEELEPEISLDLLREYIAYAKQNIEPSWPGADVEDIIAEYYAEIRQQANNDSSSAPGPRMNDALRRYSEASARARLSDIVEKQDVERATSLMDFHIGQVALDKEGKFSGEKFQGDTPLEEQKEEEYEQLKPKIIEAIGEDTLFPDAIAREVGESESKIRDYLERMAKRGEVIKDSGKVRTI